VDRDWDTFVGVPTNGSFAQKVLIIDKSAKREDPYCTLWGSLAPRMGSGDIEIFSSSLEQKKISGEMGN
jgi:hypothetical protein